MHARFASAMDQVILDLEVFVKEGGGLLVVGHDATHFGGGDEDVFGLGFAIKFIDGGFVEEVEFLAKAAYDGGKALFVEFAPDRAADEATMAGNVDPGFALHGK